MYIFEKLGRDVSAAQAENETSGAAHAKKWG